MSLVLQRALGFTLAANLSMMLVGCTRGQIADKGRVTQQQADRYMHDAIRQSSEGVVLEPSQKGLDQIERTRLNEIAQELRRPGAVCFLERAITTMEPGEIDGEQVWVEVPEGQAKFRVRVAIDGTVLATDLIESGFQDKHMDECLTEALSKQHFVESRDSFAYFIDVYYWVSLGFFAEAKSEGFATTMRRQSAEAGMRAKACLVGRAAAGEYVVTGLNLFDRDGSTVVNRVDRGELAPDVSSCIATAFKQIHIHSEPDAFVRPGAPKVTFTVADDGSVRIADERWLEMTVLEEEAEREMRRTELLEQTGTANPDADPDAEIPNDWTDMSQDMARDAGPDLAPNLSDVNSSSDTKPDAGSGRGSDPGPDAAPEPEQPPAVIENPPEPTPGPDAPPTSKTKIDLSPRRSNR